MFGRLDWQLISMHSLAAGTPMRFDTAIAACANPQALAKFLALTFS